MADTVVVSFGDLGKGESKTVIAGPGSKIVFKDIDFKDAKVDIVDADVIVSDKEGRKAIFPGMALLLFEEALAPKIFFDDDLIQPNQFLSKVGEIGNLSVQDFIAISSILRETLEQQQNEAQEEKEKDGERASEAQTVAVMQAIKEAQQAQQAAQQHTAIDQKKADNKKSSVDEEGVYIEPRPPIVEKSSSSGISFNVDEAPESPEQKPLFEIRLLQPGRVNDVTTDGIAFIRGGVGSEASAFDPSYESQFSVETLNLATATEKLIVQADNSDLFSETRMTRVIELQPILPAGFKPTRLLIEGFPDGFVVEGAVRVAGGWELLNPNLDARGNIRVNVTYPVPSDDEFTLKIKLEANFDVTAKDENGQPLPVPLQQFMKTEGEQKAVVRNVFSVEDLNYTDQDGDLVWVFANNPNGNRIFTGSGADTVTGGVASDAIDGGDGNDLLYGMRGDDTLIGGRGDDTLLGGAGSDLLEGGAGSDTVDYSAYGVRIEANLFDNTSGVAYIAIDPGGSQFEEDRVRQVENVLGGTADDTLIGDDANNLLNGGGGSDTLIGHGGNDTLIGGAGVDTADYSANTRAVDADLRLPRFNVTTNAGDRDTVLEVELLILTDFDDRVIGSDNDDTILGGDGNDRLSGGRGNDHLDGGDGNADYIDFSDAHVGVVLNLGETPDAAGYTTALIGSEVDRLKNFEHVTGSSFGDNITGSARGEILEGAGGDDTLNGAGGNDTLDGGSGADVLNGDAGDDTILVSTGRDRIDGGAGRDTMDFTGFGNATSIFANLAGAADGTVIIRGGDDQTVRNLENILATAGDDTLYGDGNDTIIAGNGADVFDGGNNTDTLDYTGSAATSITVTLNGSTTVTVTNVGDGNDTVRNVENVTGTSGNDFITGDSAANTLDGGAGNDTLVGGSGNDRLVGGANNDTLDGGIGNDTLIAGSGQDTFNGGADVDTLDYTGQGAITGGSFATLTGTITEGGLTDSVSNIENFILTANNDLLSFDTNSITALNSVNAAGGTDTIVIINGGGVDNLTTDDIDGDSLALVFTNIEVLDFRNTDLTGADKFDIGNQQLDSMASGTSLTIRVNQATIALSDINPFTQGGATITGDSTVGNIRTINWSDGTQLIVDGSP
jgi:Ca2+-binding RTX toxin-like protein